MMMPQNYQMPGLELMPQALHSTTGLHSTPLLQQSNIPDHFANLSGVSRDFTSHVILRVTWLYVSCIFRVTYFSSYTISRILIFVELLAVYLEIMSVNHKFAGSYLFKFWLDISNKLTCSISGSHGLRYPAGYNLQKPKQFGR